MTTERFLKLSSFYTERYSENINNPEDVLNKFAEKKKLALEFSFIHFFKIQIKHPLTTNYM